MARPHHLLHWFRRGRGRPTLLLHGFTGAAASWERVAARLPGAVAALHLPGHHPDLPAAADFAANVELIASAIAALDTPPLLVGYSLGGRAALAVAMAHPELIAELCLVSTHPGLATDAERAARRAADQHWVDCLTNAGLEEFVDAWQALPMWASQRDLDRDLLAEQRALRLTRDPAALAASLTTMGLGEMPSYADALAVTTLSTRWIVGEKDAKFVAIARATARACPAVDLTIIPGAGHNLPLETPDALAALIARP